MHLNINFKEPSRLFATYEFSILMIIVATQHNKSLKSQFSWSFYLELLNFYHFWAFIELGEGYCRDADGEQPGFLSMCTNDLSECEDACRGSDCACMSFAETPLETDDYN